MIPKIFTALFAFCTLFLISCLDTEEKMVINKDNSGVYSLTIDMGKLLKMMSQMDKKNEEKKEKKKQDSVIYFKSFVDTSTQLTAEEKEMIKDGSLHIKVNEAAAELKFIITLPFKKIQDLAYLRENYMKVLDKINIKDQLNNKEKKDSSDDSQEHMTGDMSSQSRSILPAQGSYTFTAAPGRISNKLTDKSGFEKQASSDSVLQGMKVMANMAGGITYKTIFVLPRPVKHYTKSANTIVSADKKTITFKSDITNLLKKPESLEYELEY